MNAKPILYSYYRSSCSWRVRAALALKGVDYEYKAINLSPKEGNQQFGEEFVRVNPLQQVPALVVNNDQVIIESLAIIEYIDEVYNTGVPLLPKDPVLRAKARAIAHTITSGIQPLQNLAVLQKVQELQQNSDSVSWAKYWITIKFEGLERLLSETSGKYCVGDDLTIADLCLPPQVYNALRFGVDMKPFPIISRINESLLAIDAFGRSHPSAQPDCSQQ